MSLRCAFLRYEVSILEQEIVIKLTEKKTEARDILKTGEPLFFLLSKPNCLFDGEVIGEDGKGF